MLNLIFISNSPKVQYLKAVLQPLLKVIIDVVPDFDHGLKDVFEKRPATVCIQDQIAGVTGESVARHIQMLLGTGAPRFMLMHNGSSTVKPIKGLFDCVINLNQPDEDLAREFQNMLQGMLGEQWHKICVTPDSPAESDTASESEPQPKADELLDELLLDFETASLPPDASATASSGLNNKVSVQTPVDEMAELLLEQARQARQNTPPTPEGRDDVTADGTTDNSRLENAPAATQGDVSAAQIPDTHKCHVKPLQETAPRPSQPSLTQVTPVTPATPKSVSPGLKTVSQKSVSTVAAPKQNTETEAAAPVAPSEFKISRDKRSSDEPIPEDLLLAFEKNYRSKNVFMKWMLLALLILGVSAAGWYAVRQNPQFLTSLKQSLAPSAPAGVKRSTTLAKPVHNEQKNTALPTAPPAAAPLLPSFVPQDGHDRSYAANNPGWERYLGKNSEVRVYKEGAAIKAIQVLALKGKKTLPDVFLKSVLKELTGSPDYSVTSREEKSGVLMVRGVAAKKADLIIYQKESSIRAFVISFN